MEVMCPGLALDVLGFALRLRIQVSVGLGGAAQLLVTTGCDGGPPTPF